MLGILGQDRVSCVPGAMKSAATEALHDFPFLFLLLVRYSSFVGILATILPPLLYLHLLLSTSSSRTSRSCGHRRPTQTVIIRQCNMELFLFSTQGRKYVRRRRLRWTEVSRVYLAVLARSSLAKLPTTLPRAALRRGRDQPDQVGSSPSSSSPTY